MNSLRPALKASGRLSVSLDIITFYLIARLRNRNLKL